MITLWNLFNHVFFPRESMVDIQGLHKVHKFAKKSLNSHDFHRG